MEGWVARRGLTIIPPARLKELSRRSDRLGLAQALSHALALSASTLVLAWSWGSIAAVPIFLVHGILINCLYAGQHECSHWTVFATRRLNDILGAIIGFVLIHPFYSDRLVHFAHHRHTRDWTKDGELVGTAPFTLTTYLTWLSGLSFWQLRIVETWNNARGAVSPHWHWLSPEQRRWVVLEARIHVALYGAIAIASVGFSSWIAVSYWLAPMLLTKAFHQLQNLGEHHGLGDDPDTLQNTRTLKGPAIMRWLMWNMSFHTAHHTFPGVPFHALPLLHAEIEQRLGHAVPSAGYVECQVSAIRAFLADRPLPDRS